MRPTLCVSLAVLCLLAPASSHASGGTADRPYSVSASPVASLTLSEAPLRSLTGASLAPAGTAFIDGISDQSLPYWDGSFAGSYSAGFFHDTWVTGPSAHIALARYVVQWNVMSGAAYPAYLSQLQAWYRDILDLGLTPEISLASYDGTLPRSDAEYREALFALLERFPATAYLEAWDEPNDTPGLAPELAARYTLIAQTLCEAQGCTVIAGNLLDSPSMSAYERQYAGALGSARFANWGIHPYLAVNTRNDATVLAFKSNLPRAGAGEQIWFTEIGAYRCEGGAHPLLLGERAQALAAAWLVDRLMPETHPEHVFYYELLFKDHRPPPCDRSDSDTALYVPAGERDGVDLPRAAASYIYDDRGTPHLPTPPEPLSPANRSRGRAPPSGRTARVGHRSRLGVPVGALRR